MTGWHHIDWSATAPEPQPRPKPMPPTPPDQQTQGAPKAPSQASASDGEEPVAPPKAAPASAAPATHPVRATPSPTTVVTGQFKAPPLALLAAGAATAPPPVKTPSPAVLIAVKAPPSTKEVIYELVDDDDDEPPRHLQRQTYYALRTKPADQQQPSSSSSPVPKPMPVPKPTPPPPPATEPEPMPPPPPTTAHPLHQVLVQIGPKAPAPALPTDVVVVPPSNGSASDSGAAVGIPPPLVLALPVRDWIFMKIPGVQPDDVDRIEKAFSHAEFDPNTHVVDEVVEWQFDDKMWVRVPLRGFQTGGVSLIEPETGDIADWVQEYRGIHCTTTRGALGIMKDRKLIPGGYGNAAYARLTEASDSVDVIETIICPGATANKNQSDVIWELKASGHSKNTIK